MAPKYRTYGAVSEALSPPTGSVVALMVVRLAPTWVR